MCKSHTILDTLNSHVRNMHIHTCILEKTQINAHLRDFCFLSGFSPHERNCTTFGIFALGAF